MIESGNENTPLYRRVPGDALLVAGAFVGLVLFLFVLPQQHPYAAATQDVTELEAIARAQDLIYESDELAEWEAMRSQSSALLQDMQRRWGRTAAVDSLRHAGNRWPVFLWRVTGSPSVDAGSPDRYTVQFDEQLRVWQVSRPEGAQRMVDREALEVLFDPGVEDTIPPAISDTLLARRFVFDATARWGSPPEDDPGTVDLLEPERTEEVVFGPSQALALASFHLQRLGHSPDAFRPDSVWLAGTEEVTARAGVRFVERAEAGTYQNHLDIETTPSGMLWGVTGRSVPLGEPEEAGMRAGASVFQLGAATDDPAGMVRLGAYVLLILVMAVVFFRKLSARVVDVNASLRDAVLGGTFLAMMALFPVTGTVLDMTGGLWAFIGQLLLIGTTTAIAGGALILILSAATDSLVRGVWPDKLHTFSQLRHFRWYNIPVGLSLVRGSALALALVGIVVGGLMLFSGTGMLLGERGAIFLNGAVGSPLGFAIGRHGWHALLLVLLVLLGIAVLVYGATRRTWMAVAAATAALMVLQVQPLFLETVSANLVIGGALGLAISLAFVRYDALTCFVGILMLGVLWETAPGWMVQGWAANTDAMGAMALWMAAAGAGMAGVLSERTGEEAGTYVPAYVRDISQHERLQHEITLAQGVQKNLLPRRMPLTKGMDLAATCLPANEVGGDYYDFIELGPDRLGIVIGDVSGKGIQAAFFMTLAKGFLQTLARDEDSPREVLSRLNDLFCINVPRGTFISMIYGVLDLKESTFTFARAGHNPIVYSRGGSSTAELLVPSGMAIGLTPEASFREYIEEQRVTLQPGDTLVLYTDGFTEAVNQKGEQFGAQRLTQYVSSYPVRSAGHLLQRVSNEVHRFINDAPRYDDMTMVVLQRKPVPDDGAVQESLDPHSVLKVRPA